MKLELRKMVLPPLRLILALGKTVLLLSRLILALDRTHDQLVVRELRLLVQLEQVSG
jgi:hypothetical protein